MASLATSNKILFEVWQVRGNFPATHQKHDRCYVDNAQGDITKSTLLNAPSFSSLCSFFAREERDHLDAFSGSQITCIFLYRRTLFFVRIVSFLPLISPVQHRAR